MKFLHSSKILTIRYCIQCIMSRSTDTWPDDVPNLGSVVEYRVTISTSPPANVCSQVRVCINFVRSATINKLFFLVHAGCLPCILRYSVSAFL